MAECSKAFHYLHYDCLWVSVCVPICWERKFLWWWLSKALIYECSRMMLGVVFLLLFFLEQCYIFWKKMNENLVTRVNVNNWTIIYTCQERENQFSALEWVYQPLHNRPHVQGSWPTYNELHNFCLLLFGYRFCCLFVWGRDVGCCVLLF